jgi:hypothetical protein
MPWRLSPGKLVLFVVVWGLQLSERRDMYQSLTPLLQSGMAVVQPWLEP